MPIETGNAAILKIRILTTLLRNTIITYNKNPLNSTLVKYLDQLNANITERNTPTSSSSSHASSVDGLSTTFTPDPSTVNTVGIYETQNVDSRTSERSGIPEPRYYE